MSGKQITSRVSEKIKTRFAKYAEIYGLSDSELAKLLLLRERHQHQLKEAVLAGVFVPPPSGSASSASKMPTITAHYSSIAPVEEFDNYVRSCSEELTRSTAAAWLLERELVEKWLMSALSYRSER